MQICCFVYLFKGRGSSPIIRTMTEMPVATPVHKDDYYASKSLANAAVHGAKKGASLMRLAFAHLK